MGPLKPYLKQQLTMREQPDSLSVGQGEDLVVIHNRIHILNPQRIHISIKHDVLAFGAAGVKGFVYGAEDVGQKTVVPIPSLRVQNSVQFND